MIINTNKNILRYVIIKNIIILLFVITLGFLSYVIYAASKFTLEVNHRKIPGLNAMHNVSCKKLGESANKPGIILGENLTGKLKFQEELGIALLNIESIIENPYVIEKVQSDNEDYAILTFDNYVLGDTSNYKYDKEEGIYTFEPGDNYKTPLMLKIEIMLSENQMQNGWDTEYLGAYEFEENYISRQGYKVNVIKSTSENVKLEQYIPERIAIFVADGIRYTLKGRTTLENFKDIIDKMKY